MTTEENIPETDNLLNSQSEEYLPPKESPQISRPKKEIGLLTFIISLVALTLLGIGGGWFFGNTYGYSQAQDDIRDHPIAFIQAAHVDPKKLRANGGSQGTAPIPGQIFAGVGKITAINGKVITVATPDQTLTLNLSADVNIVKVNPVANTDLKINDQVSILGKATTDHDVTTWAIVSPPVNTYVKIPSGEVPGR